MPATVQEYQAALARLDQYARVMDAQFRIPFTRIRLGLDALIGLVPGIGDIIGLVLGGWVLFVAVRLGAPPRLLLRMGINLGVEAVGGLLPVLGDAFDVYWKANQRNTVLLRRYIEARLAPPMPTPWQRARRTLVVLVLFALALWGLWVIGRWLVAATSGG